MNLLRLARIGVTILCLCALMAACSSRKQFTEQAPKDNKLYRPPPSVPQTPIVISIPSPSPTTSSLREDFRITATPACKDNLRFIEDLTFPDGALVNFNQSIDKRWLVENSGTCNWNERYRLKLIQGPSLGANTEQALFPARGGSQATIRILLTAPSEPGTYRTAWQAYNPHGEAFGSIIFLEFLVTGNF